jgi:hypothetical protein
MQLARKRQQIAIEMRLIIDCANTLPQHVPMGYSILLFDADRIQESYGSIWEGRVRRSPVLPFSDFTRHVSTSIGRG